MEDIPHLLVGSLERAPWGWVIMLSILGTLIKTWPVIQLNVMNAKAALRSEHRNDLHDCNERLDAMDAKLTIQTAHIHQLDMKLFGTVAAYRILHDGMFTTDPENLALSQGRAMFQQTWNGPVEALEGLVSG